MEPLYTESHLYCVANDAEQSFSIKTIWLFLQLQGTVTRQTDLSQESQLGNIFKKGPREF